MVEMSKEEWLALGEKLFGKDKNKWQFICPSCARVQSPDSIRADMLKGIRSLRFGILETGDIISAHQACYAKECNWLANGLFCGPVFIVLDATKKFDRKRMKNCTYAFAFKGQDMPEDVQLGVQKKAKQAEQLQPALL